MKNTATLVRALGHAWLVFWFACFVIWLKEGIREDENGDPVLELKRRCTRLEESRGNKDRNSRERERKSELLHIGGPIGGVSCCALHLANWTHRRKVQMCKEIS